MKYRINKNDIGKALGLDKKQEERLCNAFQKALTSISVSYDSDFSIDEINNFVAPYIKTAEEGFYMGQLITIEILGAAMEMGIKPNKPNIN